MFIDHFLSKNFYRIFNDNINDIEKKILYNLSYNKNFFTEEFEKTFNLKGLDVMVAFLSSEQAV